MKANYNKFEKLGAFYTNKKHNAKVNIDEFFFV